MKLVSSLLHATVLLTQTAPAAAQSSFTMNFDNIPVAMGPPTPPDQDKGSAVLGFYNGDPVYKRGGPSWNVDFSEEALAICSSEVGGDDCWGNFPKPPSGDSAIGTVTTNSFEFRVTPGLYVQALSFYYTDAGTGSNPGVELFSDGAQLGIPIELEPCDSGFCEWRPYKVPPIYLAQGRVTSVRFLGTPNSVVFDDIELTTSGNTSIPEPSTYTLMVTGLALLAGVRRRRATH